VLIADDQALVRAGFRAILETAGGITVVAEAATGDEAVAAARDLDIEVALLDIQMPRLDGLDAAQQGRAAEPRTRHHADHVRPRRARVPRDARRRQRISGQGHPPRAARRRCPHRLSAYYFTCRCAYDLTCRSSAG